MLSITNKEEVSSGAFSEDKATQLAPSQLQERPEEGLFILPGGYVDDNGISHREVELAPLTGNEEEFLASVPINSCSAFVVTELLSRCIKRIGSLEGINPQLARDLLVGDREYLIVKLREMTLGKKVDAVLQCQNTTCGKPMDITFSLDDLQIEPKAACARFHTIQLSSGATYRDDEGIDHRLVEFRLPTGADQEAISPMVHSDEARAINQLLACCIRRIGKLTYIDEALVAKLPALARYEIEEKIQQLAPSVEIEIEGVCPECQTTFVIPSDFTAFFFKEMRGNLQDLEREVHFIAWHYHWSEQEILSMTRKKRRRYIELLQEEIERLR